MDEQDAQVRSLEAIGASVVAPPILTLPRNVCSSPVALATVDDDLAAGHVGQLPGESAKTGGVISGHDQEEANAHRLANPVLEGPGC